ncbi:MAG: VWA domain-containing protein [Lachnospiraceae bacterium]|nr:VWA domain-containing protein [Lachnospiraceae bacterium]
MKKNLKRRSIAMILLAGLTLSACAGKDGGIDDPGTDGKQTKTYSDEEIEKRIRKVGKKYDGLYSYEEEGWGFRGKSAMNSGAVMMTEAVAEAGDYEAADYSLSIADPGPVEDVDWSREGFNAVKENGFVSVATQPFSTFGADVDTATYSNFRRSVYEQDGYGISGEAIRVEEMINYFSYDYGKPEDGEKFAVTTVLTDCPWNEDTMLLRVGVRAEEIEPQGGSNIVFLIDTSGSMFDNNKLPLAQESFKTLQKSLTKNDTVSIVTYAGSSEVLLEGAKGSDHDEIEEAIDSLEAWGSTNGEGGIIKAYEVAEKYFIEGGNNRVILATDGDLNVGVSSEAGLIELVEEKKKSGVFLSCLGFGEGNYQDDKMEALADHGNGNYSFIDCSAEAKRVLQDEIWSTLFTVAKDVKFQVEFNPAAVKGYRQIGYENRAMAAEDFADDSKDGGEVGSGQCVTVLYEIVTVDSDYEIPGVESRYGNDEKQGGDSDELLVVNIRYKEPDGDRSKLLNYPVTADMKLDEMDEDTSWAAGVAQFGMLLRCSEYAGTSDYQGIYDRLKKTPKVMDDDFRAEFLYIVKQVGDLQ